MSPHAQTSFVNDLVVMAKAYEELPQIKEQLAETQGDLSRALDTITRLEMKLMDAKSEADTLHGRIREVEVDRDNALASFLEADDRTSRALDFIKTTFGNAGALIQALEPTAKAEVKPQPTPTVEPEGIPPWATPEVDHTGDYIPKAIDNPLYADPQPTPSTTIITTGTPNIDSQTSLAGQSEPLPTDGHSDNEEANQSKPIENISDPSPSEDLPYHSDASHHS